MLNPLTKATLITTILGRLTGFTGLANLLIIESRKSTIEARAIGRVSRQTAPALSLDS